MGASPGFHERFAFSPMLRVQPETGSGARRLRVQKNRGEEFLRIPLLGSLFSPWPHTHYQKPEREFSNGLLDYPFALSPETAGLGTSPLGTVGFGTVALIGTVEGASA